MPYQIRVTYQTPDHQGQLVMTEPPPDHGGNLREVKYDNADGSVQLDVRLERVWVTG